MKIIGVSSLLALCLFCCTACQISINGGTEDPASDKNDDALGNPLENPEEYEWTFELVEDEPEVTNYSEEDLAVAKEEASEAVNRLENNYQCFGDTTCLLGTGVDTQETREDLQWSVDGDNFEVFMETDHLGYTSVTGDGSRAKAWCDIHATYEDFDIDQIPQMVHTQQLLLELISYAVELDPSIEANGEDGVYYFVLDVDKVGTVMDLSAYAELDQMILDIYVDDRGRPMSADFEMQGSSQENPGTPLQIMTGISFFDIGFTEVIPIDELD